MRPASLQDLIAPPRPVGMLFQDSTELHEKSTDKHKMPLIDKHAIHVYSSAVLPGWRNW